MKKNTLLAGLLLATTSLFAQVPAVTWSRLYGGNNFQHFHCIDATPDGGYIFGGFTINPGENGDYLIVKTDANGNQQWQNTFGGSNADEIYAIKSLQGGGYLATGMNTSMTEGGDMNSWTLKLDNEGEVIQEIIIAGNNSDLTYGMDLTSDGGFIVTGYTSSTDLFPEMQEWGQALVAKFDADGTLEWQKIYGSGGGVAYDIKQMPDGGYIVAGRSDASAGFTGTHGMTDFWIFKLNAEGDLLWENYYGGSSDEEPTKIALTPDGFIAVGSTLSNDGDVTGLHGIDRDMWVIKTDMEGNLQWQKTLGGIMNEIAFGAVIANDGGYLIAGHTLSQDGDVSENYGVLGDGWLVKLSSEGSIEWEQNYGGTLGEGFTGIVTAPDNGVVLVGSSTSSDLDLPSNSGGGDAWAIKLGGSLVAGIKGNTIQTISAYPNPAIDMLYFSENLQTVKLFTPDGKEVLTAGNVQKIGISHLAACLYLVEAEAENATQRFTFIKR
jgi:hypothetical protein